MQSGRRGLLALLGASYLLTGGVGGAIASTPADRAASEATRKPNVVWILLDTCRVNLGAYGYDRSTSPNIDKLAASGVVFEQNFAQATWTVPSVSSMMTGRYFPVRAIGVRGVSETEMHLPADGEFLVPEIFAANGYETAMVTTRFPWFTLRNRLPRAFDEFTAVVPSNPPLASLGDMKPAIFHYIARERGNPFFLLIHAWDPHFPHEPAPPYNRWLDQDYDPKRLKQSNVFGAVTADGTRFSPEDQQFLRGLYDGSILYADAQIGLLVERLKQLGLLENTLILIGSDHGEALGEDGKTIAHGGLVTYDEITRIPLIMAGPGLPEGVRVEEITENVDIVPTLVDLLSLRSDASTDGESLLPLLARADESPGRGFARTEAGNISALRDREFRYEYDNRTGEERLYPTPDRIGTRIDVLADHPDVAAAMRARIRAEVGLPAGPLMAVFLDAAAIFVGETAAVVSASENQNPTTHHTTDGRWLLYNRQFFSASFREDAPPLRFRAKVQNGRYRVLLDTYCKAEYAGKPASSLRVAVEGDAEPKLVDCEPRGTQAGEFRFLELGIYDVEDGFFDAVVDEGQPTHWAGFKSFVLLVRSDEAEKEFKRVFEQQYVTQDEADETLEQLRALGYIE